jgi:hypothetical protein
MVYRTFISQRRVHSVRLEIFTAVTMKNAVFWDVTRYGSCKNRFSEEYIASVIREKTIGEIVLVTANVVPISPILFTLTMEAIRSSETSILTRATRRNIPEHGILPKHFSI